MDMQANDTIGCAILTAADSRTGYGSERRTYNSATGTFGSGSMGGQSRPLAARTVLMLTWV